MIEDKTLIEEKRKFVEYLKKHVKDEDHITSKEISEIIENYQNTRVSEYRIVGLDRIYKIIGDVKYDEK